MNKFMEIKNDEKGSQTLEWLGIAAVIVLVVGFISSAFDASVGEKVAEKFKNFVDQIGG
jgi:hypothetical protein